MSHVKPEIYLDPSKRVDLMLSYESLDVYVEAKTVSREGPGQISAYLNALANLRPARKKILLFLTPSGARPTSAGKAPDAIPVFPLGFADLLEWIDELRGCSSSSDLSLALLQLQRWVEYFSGRKLELVELPRERFIPLCERFWRLVASKLIGELRSEVANSRWVVAEISGNMVKPLETEQTLDHLEDNYSKLGFFLLGSTLGRAPGVCFESLAGNPHRDTPIYGIVRAYDNLKSAKDVPTALRLYDSLAEEGFSQSRHWIAYRRFHQEGWPLFRPDDAFTLNVLAKPDNVQLALADDLANTLSSLFRKHRAQLDEIAG